MYPNSTWYFTVLLYASCMCVIEKATNRIVKVWLGEKSPACVHELLTYFVMIVCHFHVYFFECVPCMHCLKHKIIS